MKKYTNYQLRPRNVFKRETYQLQKWLMSHGILNLNSKIQQNIDEL